MPRRAREIEGGHPYHVLNRANARLPLFTKGADYAAFERVLEEAFEREPLRILAYCLMPNHWHLVVWPKPGAGRQVSEFMRWLTVTHTQRWHAHRHTSGTGHLYQGRFKSFPIESDEHLYTVLRYVERNAARADLVPRAGEWRWSSLWRYYRGDEEARRFVEWFGPFPGRRTGCGESTAPRRGGELEALRRSVQRGQPFGSEAWTVRIITRLGLEHTVRPQGRPRKAETNSENDSRPL